MRNKIFDALKFLIWTHTMIMGFFFTYWLVWTALGLPRPTWALVLLFAVAVLTEYGYCRWIRED